MDRPNTNAVAATWEAYIEHLLETDDDFAEFVSDPDNDVELGTKEQNVAAVRAFYDEDEDEVVSAPSPLDELLDGRLKSSQEDGRPAREFLEALQDEGGEWEPSLGRVVIYRHPGGYNVPGLVTQTPNENADATNVGPSHRLLGHERTLEPDEIHLTFFSPTNRHPATPALNVKRAPGGGDPKTNTYWLPR